MNLLEKQRVPTFSQIGLEAEHMKEQGFTEKNTKIYLFNNITHFGEVLSELDKIETYRKASHKDNESWSGTKTYEEALDLVFKPNKLPPKGLSDKVEDIKMKVLNALKKRGIITKYIVESYHYDVEGDEIDIAKLINGDPECYLKPNKKYTDFYYDLHINYVVHCGHSIDSIIEAYSKVIEVILKLEQKGYKIRVIATGIFRNAGPGEDRPHSIYSVPIKQYDTLFDIDSIIKILYPSFFRRLIFKCVEVSHDKHLDDGYGTQANGMKGVVQTSSSLTEDEILNAVLGKLYKEEHGEL